MEVAADAEAKSIELLFVDEHVVVAMKPSGLLVHRGWDNDDDVAMFRVRDAIGAYVHPLHRLDRGTSGALMFARHKEAAATLAKAFEESRIAKTYLALVRGNPPAEGTVDYPLQNSEDGPRVPAISHFRTLGSSNVARCSLVLVTPETGRLHQVRRHMRHLNHPLIGDVRHGSGVINREYRSDYGLHRLALHAWTVGFDHPVTGARVEVRANVPEDLSKPLRRLGLTEALESAVA